MKLVNTLVVLLASYLLGHLAVDYQKSKMEFLCSFTNQKPSYTTTAYELAKDEGMVLVSREGRHFMFRRSSLSVCLRKEERDVD